MSRGVAVAVLVVLAGCSGFAGAPSGGSPTDTLTPVPVTAPQDRAEPTPTPGGRELVPGVTAERVVDPFALVNAHVLGTRAASYEVRRTTTVRFPNGTLRTREITTASVSAGAERYHLSNEVLGPSAARIRAPPGRFELWTDGEQFLSAFDPRDGPQEYTRIPTDRALTQREYYRPPPSRARLLTLLSAFEIRPVEGRSGVATPVNVTPAAAATFGTGAATATSTATVSGTGMPTTASGTRTSTSVSGTSTPASAVATGTAVGTAAGTATEGTPRPVPVREGRTTPSVDGRPVGYRLVGTPLTGPAALSSVAPGSAARNASLELFVDTRGRIRWYTLSYTAVVAGERMRVAQRSRYELGGVRVDRPDWYGAAVAATDATNATATPDRRTATPTGTARAAG